MNHSTSPPLESQTLQPMVNRLRYWNALDADDRAAVLTLPHTVQSFQPHHYIVREYERTAHSCALLSGFAVRTKIVAGGARQICSVHMKGEMVDLQNSLLGKADHSVQMLTAGQAAMIPRAAVERLAFERPAVGKAMWIDTLVDGSIFREWIANVGRRDARTRISHLLCELALRLKVAGLGQQTDYEVPLTQEQLADATGLTSVHVNRTLKALERDSLIARSHPRSITIGDWKKLAETGDFNSNYLHLKESEPALA
jgi:CRP-like cAMP-binding protein